MDWDHYTSTLKGATGTDSELLHQTMQGTVLDIGCGLGIHLRRLNNATLRLGIDAGFSGLRRERNAMLGLMLICGTGYQLPFRSATFDSVMMIDVIEHLKEPLVVLKEIHRVLKLEGTLFVQTPNYPIKRLYDYLHYINNSRDDFKDDPTHVSKFNCSRLVSAVLNSGFRIELVTARNILFDHHFPILRHSRVTTIGQILGQKIIIIAKRDFSK